MSILIMKIILLFCYAAVAAAFLSTRFRRTQFVEKNPHEKCSKLTALFDDTIDISPRNDGSVLKRIIRLGDSSKGLPQQKDVVEISWKVFSKRDGALLHDSKTMLGRPVPGYSDVPGDSSSTSIDSSTNSISSSNNNSSNISSGPVDFGWRVFTFEVGAQPRQVIQGWEVGVQGMYEGEIAQLEIASHMAFGEKGVPPFIPQNEDIVCELELVKILPTWRKTVRKAGEDEHLREELIRKIQSGELPIADQVMHRNPSSPSSSSIDSSSSSSSSRSVVVDADDGSKGQRKDRKFFNPEQHQVDPRLQVEGRAEGYHWSEDSKSMEIEIPIADDTINKSDISVHLQADRITVTVQQRGLIGSQTLLQGPLHGRILPSESMWALLRESRETGAGVQSVLQLSLEKAHTSRDIWATVLDREFLTQQRQQQQHKEGSSVERSDDPENLYLQ